MQNSSIKISVIVAHGKNYELGLNNKLLWYIPEDLKNFKELTTGKYVLMGRKTFESIGKILPNRTSLVISSQDDYDTKFVGDVHSFTNNETAIGYAIGKNAKDIFVIGGASIYEELIGFADTMYVSEVDFEGEADTYLTKPDYENYNLTAVKIFSKTEISPAWKFKIFKKKKT